VVTESQHSVKCRGSAGWGHENKNDDVEFGLLLDMDWVPFFIKPSCSVWKSLAAISKVELHIYLIVYV